MTVHVGGRVELVAPRVVTDRADRWRLLLLVLASAGLHAWMIANTAVTAKDSTRFARHALALWKPNADPLPGAAKRSVLEVVQSQDDPPGYPIALGLLYYPVKAFWHGDDVTVQERALLAGQIASALAAILTVFPMYWLGRMLFDKAVGLGAAAVFQFLPVYARESSDAISDGLYLFLAATAMLLAVRAVRNPTVGRFLQTGLILGCCYLVRPEGVLVLYPCVAAVILAMGFTRRWTARSTAAWLTALTVGTALLSAPYALAIGRLTNKQGVPSATPEPMNPREKMLQGGAGGGGPPFGGWIPAAAAGTQRVGLSALEAVKEAVKATHYSVGVIGVIGLAFYRRRVRTEPAFWVPLTVAGATAAVMFGLAEFRGYVSERHGLPLAMVACYFAVAGLVPLCAWAARAALFGNAILRWPHLPAAVCVAIMLSGGRQLLRPLHENRVGHKLAADALRGQLDRAADTLVDPYDWFRFRLGWAVYNKGADPKPEDQNVRWAVMEVSVGDDGRLLPDTPKMKEDRFEMALEIFNNATVLPGGRTARHEVVFRWPEDRPRVVVVKQTLKP